MVDRIPSINPGGTAGQQIFARRPAFNQITSDLATAGAAAQNPQVPASEPPPEVGTDNDAQKLRNQPAGVRRAAQNTNVQQARQDLIGQFVREVAQELSVPGSGEVAGPQPQNFPGQTVDPQIPGQGVSDTLPQRDTSDATGGEGAPTGFETADSSNGPAVPVVDTFSVSETVISAGGGAELEDIVRPDDLPAPRRPEEGISQVPGGASRGSIVDVVT